jgi:hypothetical protein
VSKELEVLRGELEEQKTATKQWKKDWYQSVKERNAAVAELKQAQTENEALKEKLTSLEVRWFYFLFLKYLVSKSS